MKYVFVSDPGHGWLKVKKEELVKLNITKEISNYSYMDNEYAYLEEDCDAPLFLNKKKEQGVEVELKFQNTNRTSEIRNYKRYNPNRR